MRSPWSPFGAIGKFMAVAASAMLLVMIVGRGARFLADRAHPIPDHPDKFFRKTAPRTEREPVGHHQAVEWPDFAERTFHEAPPLQSRVAAGELPPVEERLPRNPLVIVPPEQTGPYGGTWTSFATSLADAGAMAGLSYETLVRWDPLLRDFLPNLASAWSMDDGARTFRFHLRQGVRWSDGTPFTADDILFWYEHVLLNQELTPLIPTVYLRNDQVMRVQKIDDWTVSFQFDQPNALFIQWVANPLLEEPLRYPRHYFEQFHPDFSDIENLDTAARNGGFTSWRNVFLDKASWRNPEKPTLDAWRLAEVPGAKRLVLERNPYYWKVDPDGNQLPYIDRLLFQVAAPEAITLRLLRGDMGVQFQHVDLDNFSLFVEHQRTGDYRVLEWISSYGAGTLMPNLNHSDPVLRQLIGDQRFRIALSHAIDREAVSETRYLGMGRPSQLTPTRTSPLYRPEYAEAHTEFDPSKANRLLDEIGLTQRDRRGIRLRPDGVPLALTIETFEGISDPGALQLVADFWREIGIDAQVKMIARPLFYERMPARLHDIAIGENSSVHTPLIDHMYTVPYGLGARHALDYAAWFMSDGSRGAEPPEEMQKVMDLYRAIQRTPSHEEQMRLAHEILSINSRNRWMIGLIGDLPGLTLVHNSFRNVPDTAVIFGNAGLTAPECYAIEPAKNE